MFLSTVDTGSVNIKSTNTVHGLSAATERALLKVVLISTVITIVSRALADLVEPASPVLVVKVIVMA